MLEPSRLRYFFVTVGLLRFILICGLALSYSHGGAQANPVSVARTPLVIYTDIISGPNTGGENNKGIYLSVFGKNFGISGLGETVKVYINNVEVDNYRYLGASKGRPDIQQITVQLGSLGNPIPGTRLPVKVVVNGLASNSNLTFTVNPGRILFVDNVVGNDIAAIVGDITKPFRHVQTPDLRKGAWGEVQAGDFIVMRGSGAPWTDLGFNNHFVVVQDKSGSAPTGKPGSGPISLMGYPGDDVFINAVYDPTRFGGAISSADSARQRPGKGAWMTISNLRVEGGGTDGVVNVQQGYINPAGSNWRVVNNELTAATAVANVNGKAAGIAGNGNGQVWLGNHIHHIFCGPAGKGPLQNHGIYIDGDGSYEIAYNLIENIPGGNGFQTFVNGTNGSPVTNNISIHHNVIHDTGKHGINLADQTQNGVSIYNNVIYNTYIAGIRFNTNSLHKARVYNNTFYNTNTSGNSRYGAVMNDWNLPGDALDMRNNIFVPHVGTPYAGGSVGFVGRVGKIQRNLWHGGTGNIGFDSHPVAGNPRFVSEGVDFHLSGSSPAIDAGSAEVSDLVTDDFDVSTSRPRGRGFDIGAYESIR